MRYLNLAALLGAVLISIYTAGPAAAQGGESIDEKVEALLAQMTLEEKAGQLNQYNGFWDFTGPAPTEGDAQRKIQQLEQGLVGSMLNVIGVDAVTAVQKLAVEKSRLGIPLIFGFDVIHGHRTIFPVPLAESASWDLEAIENLSLIHI